MELPRHTRFDSLYGDRTVLEAVVERSAESGRAWLLGTLLVALALAYVVFYGAQKKAVTSVDSCIWLRRQTGMAPV